MLNSVEHEKSFITSVPGYKLKKVKGLSVIKDSIIFILATIWHTLKFQFGHLSILFKT